MLNVKFMASIGTRCRKINSNITFIVNWRRLWSFKNITMRWKNLRIAYPLCWAESACIKYYSTSNYVASRQCAVRPPCMTASCVVQVRSVTWEIPCPMELSVRAVMIIPHLRQSAPLETRWAVSVRWARLTHRLRPPAPPSGRLDRNSQEGPAEYSYTTNLYHWTVGRRIFPVNH